MITRLVKLTLDPSKEDEFTALFEENKSRISGSEGCVEVSLHKDVSNPGVLFTISRWETEQHLNDYRESPLFGAIWPTVKHWMIDKPEAWSMCQAKRLSSASRNESFLVAMFE